MRVRHLTSVDGDLVRDLDPDRYPAAQGPIHLAEDLTVDQTAVLARAATYRAALFEERFAGVAVGIRPRLVDSHEETRRRAVDELAAEIDAGTLAPDPVDGPSSVALVRGIGAALDAASGGLAGRSVALEQVGPDGLAIAREVVRRGGKVVGMSTHHGAIATAAGFDVDDIASRFETHGDLFVAHIEDLELHRSDELAELAVDALVLSRPIGSLDPELAERIGADVVVPSTPAPWTDAGLHRLRARRVTPVPDFAALAGPSLLATSPGGLTDDERLGRVDRMIGERLTSARLARMDPIRYCASLADTFLTTWVDEADRPDGPPALRPAELS